MRPTVNTSLVLDCSEHYTFLCNRTYTQCGSPVSSQYEHVLAWEGSAKTHFVQGSAVAGNAVSVPQLSLPVIEFVGFGALPAPPIFLAFPRNGSHPLHSCLHALAHGQGVHLSLACGICWDLLSN